MNNALAIIWVIFLASVILFIFMLGSSLVSFYFPEVRGEIVSLFTACEPLPNLLIELSPNNSKICPDGNIYIPTLGMIVSSLPIPYINACLTACPTADISTLTCPVPEQMQSFNQCINLTQPNGCSSLSYPVAFSGTSYYYVNAMGSC